MRNEDSEGAPAAVNPPENRQLPPVVSFALITAVILLSFFSGVFLGPPMRQWWHEAKTLSAMPSLTEEAKLLDEAAIYTLFWERRVPRLQKAAVRFGWNEREFQKALRLIDAAKPRFEAVRGMHLAWGKDSRISYALLKEGVDLLYEQLTLTFCEEFQLVCLRGVPPDQAHFKALRPLGKL